MSGLTRRQLLSGAVGLVPIIALSPSPAYAVPHPPLPPWPPWQPPQPPEPGQPPVMTLMSARAAFDSYGMNCHLSFFSESVWENTDAAVQWLQELGVGAVRQYLPTTDHGRAAVKAAMNRLGETEVRWCCPTIFAEDIRSLDAARAVVNGQLDWLQANTDLALLDSLPGPNEPNSDGKAIGEWVQRTRWAMQALWEETRKRPAFDDVLVQGPPLNMKGGLAVTPDVAALGDLSQWMDRGDAHIYPGDWDPGFLVDERLALLEPIHPGKPVCVSEGGYTTAIGRGYTGGADLVPEDVANLYAPKHLLVHALGGRQFFSYELLDEAPPYKDNDAIREAGFGLIQTPRRDPGTWQAKPSFDAVRRLLTLVRDVKGHQPVDLALQITGGGDTLRTVLLHRSDGKHMLAIWQAVKLYEWDGYSRRGRYLPVDPLTVTITLPQPLPVAVYEPSTQDLPVDRFTALTFSQTVGGELLVLEIG